MKGNIKISQKSFDELDFSDKKSMLEETYPELTFHDMSESEFDEYFTIKKPKKKKNK